MGGGLSSWMVGELMMPGWLGCGGLLGWMSGWQLFEQRNGWFVAGWMVGELVVPGGL